MSRSTWLRSLAAVCAVLLIMPTFVRAEDAQLPRGVKAVWNMAKAWREVTPTRERICINGLWRWQPTDAESETVPADNWGYFKVPGPWPKTRWGRADESQTVYPHPSWKDVDLSRTEYAWYQREVEIPKNWAGRRIVLDAQYVHTSATFYLDGKRASKIKSRGGTIDLTALCVPGRKQVLSALAHHPKSGRDFRGLCGDVYLSGVPAGERIDDVKVSTSVRQWKISADTAVSSLAQQKQYTLSGVILDDGKVVKTITSRPFRAQDVRDGRITFSNDWRPEKLWDTHTPQNQYDLKLSLLDAGGKVLDEFGTVRFGFRELWIDGRYLRLNGSKFFCFASPLDVGEVSAYGASYAGTCTMIRRFKRMGVNIAYTHNYSCVPGSHMSFEEIMKACDDKGLLIALSHPKFYDYKWKGPDEGWVQQCTEDVEFYVRRVQNHPSVVIHMPTGKPSYNQGQNPDQLDGIFNPFPDPENPQKRNDPKSLAALKVESMIRRFDNSRLVVHHHSCNMPDLYTVNSYLNFVPIQERSDWLEHWATKGVKPLLIPEYGPPILSTWTDQREWREKGSLRFPAEWGAQFRGDAAYQLPDNEKRHPNPRLSRIEVSENVAGVQAMYIARNWPAFRTWGLTMFNNWNLHYTISNARQGAANPSLPVDWDNLQKPGFSPDFLRSRRWDIAYKDSDWTITRQGEALLRYNRPLLAYIAGKFERFTSQDHNFTPGEPVEKQVIVINNSRRQVVCDCTWSLKLPKPVGGAGTVTVETGEQTRIPVSFALPADIKPGSYELALTAKFNTGETQNDVFTIDVLPEAPKPRVSARVAVFDPKGETGKLLTKMGVRYSSVNPDADLAACDIFIIGKHALTSTAPKLDLSRVRTGLKVIVFEQSYEVLEKRFGFRAQEYGLRRLFGRVAPNEGVLAGLTSANLHDWRGEGTTVGPRLDDPMKDPTKYPMGPRWCGFNAKRAWRCGCQGTVTSVLIEKPTSGDFVPLLDGGFSLQYSPLMEYREGTGLVLFCQLDVTGRTQSDPAAMRLTGNLLKYVASWKPTAQRKLLYVGAPAGKAHLEQANLAPGEYKGGALSADQVLVVGPGGGKELVGNARFIDAWLKADGRLIAVGLDADEANAFLPFKVTMKKTQYTCGDYTLPAAGSPFAGIAPADLYNREPKQVPLVAGGTLTLGDGVLATGENANVVFFQIAPWQFENPKDRNLRPNFRRFSFALSRLLGNMGLRADTPLLKHMENPLNREELTAPASEDGKLGRRWLAGLYLDKPRSKDDPYRYLRW